MNLEVLNEINVDFIKKYDSLLDIIGDLEPNEIEKINSLCTYINEDDIILVKLIVLYNIKVNLGDKFNDFIASELNKINDKKAERSAKHAEAVMVSNWYKDCMFKMMLAITFGMLVLLSFAIYYLP